MDPLIDQLVRTSFPHPIAAAWHRVSLSNSSADRIKRLLAALEVLVRVTCALQMPDYLRGPPDDAVEKTLPYLERPALGHWVQLLRSLLKALESRTEPRPFMPEAIAWYFSKGRPSDAAKRLDDLVVIRNEEAHGRALSGAEQESRATELLAGLRVVLTDVSFLGSYKPFRVLTSGLSRRSGFSGRLQFLVGSAAQPEPVHGAWPARLFQEGVYLSNPSGTEVLEISPFFAVLHDPGPREDAVFVIAGTQKQKKLLMKNDSTGTSESVLVPSYQGDVALDAWLAARASHAPWQKNEGASENFAVQSRSTPEAEVLSGRFQVKRRLGEGGMATVYLVWDLWDEAEYALKVLHAQIAEDSNYKERFRREARTMKRLRHPNILAIEEAAQLDDGRLYLKLPVLLGGTLQDKVQGGASPPDLVVRWATQMLSALAHLHDKGVVHRDIKPSNFLLDEQGNTYLSDFGIALGGDDVRLTRTLEQMGSVAYMAPEQRRGGSASASSDVYSLGVVLHELLSGKEGGVTPGKGIAGPLGDLVRALCAEDPTDRLTAQQALERVDPSQKGRAEGAEARVKPSKVPGALSLEERPVDLGEVQLAPGRVAVLTRPFSSAGPVTRELWHSVMSLPDPEQGSERIDEVTWEEAILFCNTLSEQSGLRPAYQFSEPKPKKNYSIDDMGRMLREVMPFKLVPSILGHFKTETLAVMQLSPQRLTEVTGISEKDAAEYASKWDKGKYFVRDTIWDRKVRGYRLPTEAEWVKLAEKEPPKEGESDWLWCADPGPVYQTVPTPLQDGRFEDPSCDTGPRRLIRSATGRRASVPITKEKGLGLRIVR